MGVSLRFDAAACICHSFPSLTFSSRLSSLCDSRSDRALLVSPVVLEDGADLPLRFLSLAAMNSSVRTLYDPLG